MSEPRLFSLDYVEHAVLHDGTRVRLRLVRPDDREVLRAGFDRLSPESRYTRFLASKTALSEDELRYLCELDHENHLALGAVFDDQADSSPVGLGVARFVRLRDQPDTAEAAIAVVDEMQRRGLGRLLLLRLIAAAAERGIARFHFEVLESNAGMTALIAELSPERTVDIGSGVMSIEMPLPRVEPMHDPTGAPLGGPTYRLFRAAAQNAVEWTDAVRRLWRR